MVRTKVTDDLSFIFCIVILARVYG